MTVQADSNRTCLAVIPARGGSRRIPHKNIKYFRGRPLISYTIDAAVRSTLFARVVVSTDDRQIADIAEKCGAEVPFMREPKLADDLTPVSMATVDALRRLDPEGREYRHVAQLMANCPLRTEADVRKSYDQFVRSDAASQISVCRYGWQNPWWALKRSGDFVLHPLFHDEITKRSQDLPELFCPTGVIWWAKAEVLRREHTFHVQGRTGWEIPWQRGIDIDTGEDWAMAELIAAMSEEGSRP